MIAWWGWGAGAPASTENSCSNMLLKEQRLLIRQAQQLSLQGYQRRPGGLPFAQVQHLPPPHPHTHTHSLPYLGERELLGTKAKSRRGKKSLGPIMPKPFVKLGCILPRVGLLFSSGWPRPPPSPRPAICHSRQELSS